LAGPVFIVGRLSPGSSFVGTLATGPANITGTYECRIHGAASDRLAINGGLDLTGATIHLAAIRNPSQPSYLIATYTGTLTAPAPPVLTGLPGYRLDLDTPGEVKLVAEPGYYSWALGFPGLAETNPEADPDADGALNLMEYVLGGDPRTASPPRTLAQSLEEDHLVLEYSRSDASQLDTIQTGQWSTDLTHWEDIPPILIDDNGSAPDCMEIRIPLSYSKGGRLFGRMKASLSKP
jgi:hypothetical protein